MGLFDGWNGLDTANTAANLFGGGSVSTWAGGEALLNAGRGNVGNAIAFGLVAAASSSSSNNNSNSYGGSSNHYSSASAREVLFIPQATPECFLSELNGLVKEIDDKATELKAHCEEDYVALTQAAVSIKAIQKLVKDNLPSAEKKQNISAAASSPRAAAATTLAAREVATSTPDVMLTTTMIASELKEKVVAASPSSPLPCSQEKQSNVNVSERIKAARSELIAIENQLSTRHRHWYKSTMSRVGFIISAILIFIPVMLVVAVIQLPIDLAMRGSPFPLRGSGFIRRGCVSVNNPSSFFARDSVKKIHAATEKLESLSKTLQKK